MTKLTWDNAALLEPGDGRAARASTRATWSSCRTRGRTVEAPVWIMPGQADDSVTVHLGYGRHAGRAGRQRGRVQRLRAADVRRARVRRRGRRPARSGRTHDAGVDPDPPQRRLGACRARSRRSAGSPGRRRSTTSSSPDSPTSTANTSHEPPKDLTLYHDDFTPDEPGRPATTSGGWSSTSMPASAATPA